MFVLRPGGDSSIQPTLYIWIYIFLAQFSDLKDTTLYCSFGLLHQLFTHCCFSRTWYFILSPLVYRRSKAVQYLKILLLAVYLRRKLVDFNKPIIFFLGFIVGLLKHILALTFKISDHIFISICGLYFPYHWLICNDITSAIQYLNSPIRAHLQLNWIRNCHSIASWSGMRCRASVRWWVWFVGAADFGAIGQTRSRDSESSPCSSPSKIHRVSSSSKRQTCSRLGKIHFNTLADFYGFSESHSHKRITSCNVLYDFINHTSA